MEVGKTKAIAGKAVEVRGVYLAPKGAQVGEAQIVGDDDQKIRPFPRHILFVDL
jgi:hypothetical protein